MTTYIHSPIRNALRSPIRAPNIWEWYNGATAASAWETLLDSLQTETDGMVLYFTDPTYPRALVRDTTTPANAFDGDANDKLTYTSPSLKNVMGADGTIKYANHNLVLQSQTFDNASWTKANGSVTSNAGTAPDGTTTADKFVPDSTTSIHRVSQGLTTVSGLAYRVNVYLKASGVRYVYINTNSELGARVTIDLQTGSTDSGGTSLGNLTATSAGDDWWKVTYTGVGAAASNFLWFQANTSLSATDDSYLGNGTDGFLVWGAELKAYPVHDAGTLADYVPTTTAAKYRLPIEYDTAGDPVGLLVEEARTELTLYNRDFTNAAWTKSNMTAAKTATGADGVTNSASTLTATAGNATVLQAITSGSAARITGCRIKRRTGTGNIDLTQDNGGTWTTITVTSSWTRVSIASVTSANPTVGIRIVTSGDEVDVDFFTHQVGAFLTSDIATTSATVTRAADNISMATSAFPVGAAWTLVSEVEVDVDEGYAFPVFTRLTGAGARFLLNDTGAGQFSYFDSGSSVAPANTVTEPFTAKIAIAGNGSSRSMCLNGGTVATAANAVSTPSSFILAQSGDGTKRYKYIKFLNRRAADADLALESA